jgi:hypothetical protein
MRASKGVKGESKGELLSNRDDARANDERVNRFVETLFPISQVNAPSAVYGPLTRRLTLA